MSTSLLYHAYSLDGVQYKSTHYEGGKVIFKAEITRKFTICPHCKNSNTNFKGKKERRFHCPPSGNRQVFLDLTLHRLECPQCNRIWLPKLPFMEGTRRMTKSFIRFALTLLLRTTIEGASDILGISWHTLKDLHKEKLRKMYPDICYEEIRAIGIDEFSIRKGHEYMTIVTNLDHGTILFAVEGKNKEAVLPFLKILSRKAPNLEVAAIDLGDAFAAAVKEALPNVKIVYDHFHVTAIINKALDEIRKDQQRLMDDKGIKTLKGNRYLTLYNYENLDPNKKIRLNSLLSANKPLSIGYALKEQFREFWKKTTQEEGAQFILSWIIDAKKTKIKPLVRLANTLLEHSVGLLNYFIHKVSNGITEGINNKIKTLKRQAYGYRDMEYFKLRLYHLHKQDYSLTG